MCWYMVYSIKNIEIDAFNAFRNLKELDLSYNNLKEIIKLLNRKISTLRSLDLRSNFIEGY